MAGVRVRVLGTLEVVDEQGRRMRLGPRKQRMLLAVMACRPAETVSFADLVDALWNGAPPRSAGENLRAYVHGLRGWGQQDLVVGGRRTGYTLAVDPRNVDRVDFIRSIRDGTAALRSGDVPAARQLLRYGLELWRGAPFTGLESCEPLAVEAVRLTEQWLAATEDRVDADLRAGCAEELVPELEELTHRHPYRERLYVLLMMALYRCGRQVDALGTYQRARRLLADEMGIEPGQQLRQTEQAVLRGEPWLARPSVEVRREQPWVEPAELPAGPDGFAGRDGELARLDELTARPAALAVGSVVVVVGVAGVGKTALVVHWGRRAAPRYPDGQVFVDLRGFHVGEPVRPDEALGRLLRTFGVDPARLPPTVEEAAALYRSVLARRRVLLVFDNAASAEQVRPLLPGNPECGVVITSRERLAGLVAHNSARMIEVNPLTSEGAVRILHKVLPPDLVAAEPAAVPDVARACGYLPLALRIAAANLTTHSGQALADYAAQLRGGDRIAALRIDGDESDAVRTAFDLSYAGLTAEHQRMFRLLGLVPGPDITPPAAAALADRAIDQVHQLLDRLVAAHLVQHRATDRYSQHDLLHEYARSQVRSDEPAEVAAAVDRLYRHYVGHAAAAGRELTPEMLRLPATTPLPTDRPDPDKLLDWCAAELPNLVAICQDAAQHGPYDVAWLIADGVRGYCWLQSQIVDWSLIAQAAGSAAALAGGPVMRAFTAVNLGHCSGSGGDFRSSARYYEDALTWGQLADWPEAQATALRGAGWAYGMLGDLPRAVDHQRQALDLSRRLGQRGQEGLALAFLGVSSQWCGRLTEARALLDQALALLRAERYHSGQIFALTTLAEVLVLMDCRRQAGEAITELEQLARHTGMHSTAVTAQALRSAVAREDGDAKEALDLAARAEALLRLPDDRTIANQVHQAIAAAFEALGDLQQAVAHFRIAHQIAVETSDGYEQTDALISLAAAEHRIGDTGAEATLCQVLNGTRTVGYRVLEGRTMAALSEICFRRGDVTAAGNLARMALAVQDETGWRLDRTLLRRIITTGG
jgi:DNA-binding SARP family transcriptional activator/tetratricopeptide (TPR) repeat protein